MAHTTQATPSRGAAPRREDESDAAAALGCPTCSRELVVAGFKKTFVLICRCGYQLSPDNPPGVAAASLAKGLKALLLAWEQQLDALQTLCRNARSDGLPGFSAVMDRHVHNLHSRIERLKRFSQPPSGRYLLSPPPQSCRPPTA
jgi:hypothetical protein